MGRPVQCAAAASTRRSYSSKSWNCADGLGIGSNRIVHGIRSMTSHSRAFLSSMFNTVSTLLTVLGARSLQTRLQMLDILARDRVELLAPEHRDQMDAAGWSPSRRCRWVSVDSPARVRPEIAARTPRGWAPPSQWRWSGRVSELGVPLTFPGFAPPLRRRFRGHRRLATLPMLRVVREFHPDIHFPTSPSIRSDCHAHRCSTFPATARTFGAGSLAGRPAARAPGARSW